MLRRIFSVFIALFASVSLFAQSGSLKGKVLDLETNEPVPFASVSIQQNGNIITGGQTDFDGNYFIKPIPAGVYDIKVSYVGYNSTQMNKLRINAGSITFQDFKIKSTTQQIDEVVVTDYKVPLISKDQTVSGGTVTSDDIQKMPGRSADAIATTVGGVYSENGSIGSIRGARSEGTVYVIDGVKVRGSNNLPKSAIDQITVMTGGLPAQYGDATGGVISITTRGPSKETFGSFELVTSKFLDPYGFYLGELFLSGPLYSKNVKDKNDSTKIVKDPRIGYLLTLNYTYQADYEPYIIGNWYAKDDAIDYITSNPLSASTTSESITTIPNACYLHNDSFYNTDKKKDGDRTRVMAAGKLDFKITKNINFTLGGTYDYSNTRINNLQNSLFNSQNNGQQIYNNWRAYGRLTQKFSSDAADKESSASIIKNAFYQIQADYSQENIIQQDKNHKDNFFDYGYIGKFTTYRTNTYAWTDTLAGFSDGVYRRNSYMDTLYAYEPGTLNPDMATYNSKFYSLYDGETGVYMNKEIVENMGGLLNGQFPESIYGLWTSPGTPYNYYAKSVSKQFRIGASGSADIFDHEISFGFDFEQRNDADFRINNPQINGTPSGTILGPAGLWTLARSLTNFHLLQLDIEHPIYITDANGVFQDTIDYNWLYNAQAQTQFDINLRKHLGIAVDGKEWLDLDSYDPSDLSIDYFSADELFNNGNSYVYYSGYDHHGKKLNHKPSLEEFFTAKDEYGNYKREIAPFEPTYGSVYLQDKFAFYDLIFNVGLRIDRYDANQMVLKDPYCFFETYKVQDVRSIHPDWTIPSNIGDDYVVYVDNYKDPNSIKGYRTGFSPSDAKWYNSSGTLVSDPDDITGTSGIIQPYLVDPDANLSSNAFKDYDPQITVMPRISFSFPISDVALFFAHYDILSNRPSGYGQMNPMSYLFITSNNEITNPNLKPEKTIDYELGFNQKLSNTSSIKLSAFYREMRDQIQAQFFSGAYPVNYMTYSNIDFGTIKGFQASFDLRQTGNVSLRANYTLQFANGTGSDATTSRSLIATGQSNIRTTLPLNFDQRHHFQFVLDYRFASGRLYNGPKWFGMEILKNTGANIVIDAGSGSPYSRRDVNTNYLVGSLNGSRKPFRSFMNIKIDRTIDLVWGKKEGSKGKEASLNIYLDISNVLNQKIIINVYETTGNPDDNGYLTAAKNQADIKAQYDEIAYRNYYTMLINNPDNYGSPRTIRLGAVVSF